MRRIFSLSSLSLCMLIFTLAVQSAYASDHVLVIAGKESETMDMLSLRLLYTGQKRGAQLLDLPSDSSEYIVFYLRLLGRTPSQVKIIWSELIFSGQCLAPRVMASDAEVISYVSTHPTAVGYVSEAAMQSFSPAQQREVKVILKL